MWPALVLAALALACTCTGAHAALLHPQNVRIHIARLPARFSADLAADDRCGVCDEDGTDVHALFAQPHPFGTPLANLSGGLAVHFVNQVHALTYVRLTGYIAYKPQRRLAVLEFEAGAR